MYTSWDSTGSYYREVRRTVLKTPYVNKDSFRFTVQHRKPALSEPLTIQPNDAQRAAKMSDDLTIREPLSPQPQFAWN